MFILCVDLFNISKKKYHERDVLKKLIFEQNLIIFFIKKFSRTHINEVFSQFKRENLIAKKHICNCK